MDQYIGKVLDNRYEIIELIGTGGMANVYKAKCHLLNRLVAVKILKSDLAQDEEFRRRFQDESRAVAMLSHPNIVAIYDVSRGSDLDYIVMELIDGITLKQYMERRGQMDWREALHFMTQIIKALSHAHSRGIIHRDIKPQNIMILRDGTVKVADFGIACLSNTAQTLTQEALGSVHYISPEQATGARPDARSDLYSAGVVLYEMLTGRLPFEGDSAVSVAIQHLNSIPLSPREINPDVPEALELICMKAMASDISKRYASADEMLADLEKFRKDPNVDLNFVLQDLRSSENSEPTRMIDTSSVRELQRKQKATSEDAQEEDEEPEDEAPRKTWLKILLPLIAVALIIGLGVMIRNSLQNTGTIYQTPNLLGKTMEEAMGLDGIKDGTWKIQQAGEKVSEEYAKGQIIEQSPEPGKEKKSDLVITVYISSGPDMEVMPDLVKKEQRIASMQLSNLGLALQIQIEEVYDDDVAEGYVISTKPEKGTELKQGDSITLVCSKGPQPVTVAVPDFVTRDIDTVQTWLDSLGLKIGHVEEQFSSEPAGQVIHQSVDVGTLLEKGSSIDFIVSKGEERELDENGTDDDTLPDGY